MDEHRDHAMTGRVARIEARLESLEKQHEALNDMMKSSVDDIKATIRSEVSDLKSEQIADIKRQVLTMDQRLDGQNIMLGDVRSRQESWDTGASILNWLIRSLVAVGGLVMGYFGAKHIG
jgi:hypothetical protein